MTDVNNCGACGVVCPTPVHATAACIAGVCGRGACAPGTFDFDGDLTFGCEATCREAVCRLGDGTTVSLSSPPLPSAGAVAHAFASGGSFGSEVQTTSTHTNFGVLGEATPPGIGGVTEQTVGRHRHIGGFIARLRSR